MWFPGVITTVPFTTDKMILKPPKSKKCYEREESMHATWSQQYLCSPKFTGSRQVRLSPWASVSSGDMLDKHSYTGLKLGCTTLKKGR